MSDVKDGGTAFPNTIEQFSSSSATSCMSLRDWFAGQALAGLCAFPGRTGENNKPEHFARYSYALADALLDTREATR